MPSSPASLRQEDFTDREILAALYDCVGEDGYAATEDLVNYFGGTEEDKHLSMCIGSRLSVMSRNNLKLVKRHPKERKLWKITAQGEEVRSGELKRQMQTTLESMGEGETLALTTALMRRSVIQGSARSATLTRRVMNYGVARRRYRRNGRG